MYEFELNPSHQLTVTHGYHVVIPQILFLDHDIMFSSFGSSRNHVIGGFRGQTMDVLLYITLVAGQIPTWCLW